MPKQEAIPASSVQKASLTDRDLAGGRKEGVQLLPEPSKLAPEKTSAWIRHSLQQICMYGMMLSVVGGAALHVLSCCMPPPSKLPFLYDAGMVSLSFANFLPAAVYLNVCQWTL